MSAIRNGIAVFQNLKESVVGSTSNRTVPVYLRLMFVRIGEIDTLNEKYQAQATIEARWVVDLDKLVRDLPLDDQKRLTDGQSVSPLDYGKAHWHPQPNIENALGDVKEQIRYSAKQNKQTAEIYICEHRDIKGLFWEKLELHHFSSDVQDLSISVASIFDDGRVLLIPDSNPLSGVNREAFVDQQEWSLYEHVDIQQRYVKEYLIRTVDQDEDEEEDLNSNEDRQRSIITVTCHAGW